MNLVKIADLYPDYQEDIFDGVDLKSFSVYDNTDDKVGSVEDIIVDQTGRFRYLVIDTGFWIFGKKVLLPVGRAIVNIVNHSDQKVYVSGLTREQVAKLPEYEADLTIDDDYEERVRMIYRGVEYDPNNPVAAEETRGDHSATDYDREPSLYAHQETDNCQSLKLYEERLVANKQRFRVGEVIIGKQVATETATVSVPITKEKVVIERSDLTGVPAAESTEATFSDREIARVEVYEESADIEKKTFVREEVSVRKVVERDTVSAETTLRREELAVETEGEVSVDGNL